MMAQLALRRESVGLELYESVALLSIARGQFEDVAVEAWVLALVASG